MNWLFGGKDEDAAERMRKIRAAEENRKKAEQKKAEALEAARRKARQSKKNRDSQEKGWWPF